MDPGERKKRKVEFKGDKDEEEKKDDEEVEEFFALIRSNREIRERMNMMNAGAVYRDRVNMEQQNKASNENVRPVVAMAAPWNPSFRAEDFMEKGPSTSNPNEPLSNEEDKEDKKKDDDEETHVGLDLNLSL